MKKTHITEHKFADFGLQPQVIDGLEKKGFVYCTPIQALALPDRSPAKTSQARPKQGLVKRSRFLLLPSTIY